MTSRRCSSVPASDGAAATLGRDWASRRPTSSSDERLAAYAPAAWAAAIAELIDDADSPIAVLAGGSDRGNEVLAHLAARTGRPMAANVVSVTVGIPWRLTRQRWAGSLLEDATLDADVHLLTVAPHVVPVSDAERASGAGAAP